MFKSICLIIFIIGFCACIDRSKALSCKDKEDEKFKPIFPRFDDPDESI